MLFKNIAQMAATFIVAGLFVFIVISMTSVPEVYVASDTLGDGVNPSSWEIRQIVGAGGDPLPHQQWQAVLEGRFRVIPVSPHWYPSLNAEEHHDFSWSGVRE